MLKYATLNDAKKYVINWGGQPGSVQHIGNFGNSVYSFVNSVQKLQILRFTDADFRTDEQILAELQFVNKLYHSGVSVASALANLDGQLTMQIKSEAGLLICSSIVYIEGVEVKAGSLDWNEIFFKEWGRHLAHIHKASINICENANKPKRWVWNEEILFQQAEHLMPRDDQKSIEELNELFYLCKKLNNNSNEFGIIHADHAPQNFRYNAQAQNLTSFDFGNCCHHWFMADLAISLSTVRRQHNREIIRENILSGYSEIKSLPAAFDEQINLFIRLRVLYVYLSRLHLWSHERNANQVKIIDELKNSVHLKKGWS